METKTDQQTMSFKIFNNIVTFVTLLLSSNVGHSKSCIMTFNTSKCEFLRIAKKLNPILMQYYIQNDAIKEVKHTKYLEVIINHRISWNEHINYITSKANNVKCFL